MIYWPGYDKQNHNERRALIFLTTPWTKYEMWTRITFQNTYPLYWPRPVIPSLNWDRVVLVDRPPGHSAIKLGGPSDVHTQNSTIILRKELPCLSITNFIRKIRPSTFSNLYGWLRWTKNALKPVTRWKAIDQLREATNVHSTLQNLAHKSQCPQEEGGTFFSTFFDKFNNQTSIWISTMAFPIAFRINDRNRVDSRIDKTL